MRVWWEQADDGSWHLVSIHQGHPYAIVTGRPYQRSAYVSGRPVGHAESLDEAMALCHRVLHATIH